MTRRRIAVLGGGAGSLFAVWNLVHADPDAYDITVYQAGWRLGGKGASGRRASDKRIEEHGLHLMFGFYENVFRMIREAYAECYGDDTIWQRFFKSEDTAVSMIRYLDDAKTRWEPWHIPYPTANQDRTPGDGSDERGDAAMLEIVHNVLRWIEGLVHPHLGPAKPELHTHLGDLAHDALHALIEHLPPWLWGATSP